MQDDHAVLLAFLVGLILAAIAGFGIGRVQGSSRAKRKKDVYELTVSYHERSSRELTPKAVLPVPSKRTSTDEKPDTSVGKGSSQPPLVGHTKARTTPVLITESAPTAPNPAGAQGYRLGDTDRYSRKICDDLPEKLDEEYAAIEALIENSSLNLLITGEAGTGKSTLLKHFVCHTKKRVCVVAPTGVAALNAGGVTIHSFFSFPPRFVHPEDVKLRNADVMKAMQCLIIDEVSMVRAEILDRIDEYLRLNRETPNLPFGGVQVILFGDVFQLSPIVGSPEEGEYFSSYYATPYFFSSRVYSACEFQVIQLCKNYRQSEANFMRVLHRMRRAELGPEDLSWLQQLVNPEFQPLQKAGYVTLTPTRARASRINLDALAKLRTSERIFTAAIQGKYEQKYYPTDYELRLKIDAQVMFLVNDSEKRYVNGTIGYVRDFGDETVTVEIPRPKGQPSFIVPLQTHVWTVPEYRIDHWAGNLVSKAVGKFEQIPLSLAWAITIHKAQGLTLDHAVFDLADGAFSHGQVYVALSRLRSASGLVLRRQVKSQEIMVDQRVADFDRQVLTSAHVVK